MAPVYDLNQFLSFFSISRIHRTNMTGHLSLADVQAKEVESLVLERAELGSDMHFLVVSSDSTHGLSDRTPFQSMSISIR